MKYMLLIHQGATPLPGSDEWTSLPEEEKNAVYSAYKALNETPGVSPGLQLQPPQTATTVRLQDGKTLTTDGPFVALKDASIVYNQIATHDLGAVPLRNADHRRPMSVQRARPRRA